MQNVSRIKSHFPFMVRITTSPFHISDAIVLSRIMNGWFRRRYNATVINMMTPITAHQNQNFDKRIRKSLPRGYLSRKTYRAGAATTRQRSRRKETITVSATRSPNMEPNTDEKEPFRVVVEI